MTRSVVVNMTARSAADLAGRKETTAEHQHSEHSCRDIAHFWHLRVNRPNNIAREATTDVGLIGRIAGALEESS